MNEAYEIGAAALRAEQRALETHANNVANINTPTFKRSENDFSEIVARTGNAGSTRTADTPTINASGVRVSQNQMLFEQGDLQVTNNPLDLAIDGRGFIELMGPRGETLLWRGGRLRVNSDGMLATATGIPLKTAISVPYDATQLTIDRDGVINAATSNGGSVEIGQISLVTIDNDSAVDRLDNGLFRLVRDAQVDDLIAGEEGGGILIQGALESSNVDLTREMVQMMIVQRAYAANAQIVQAADQLASITNNLKR